MITASVTGNVGKQPELKTTAAGKPMATFSVASSYKKDGRDPITTWIDVLCFDEQASVVCERLGKGDRVVVSGKLSIEKYQKKDGQEGTSVRLLADEVSLSLRFPKRETANEAADRVW